MDTKRFPVVSLIAVAALALAAGRLLSEDAGTKAPAPAAEAKADVEASIVGVQYEGVKMWLPGTVFAKKGNTVKLKLINKIPGKGTTHGFAIDAFNVKKVVAEGTTETVTFTADKDGIFPIYCQLHPAHVGGQLVVLP
jgi:nitrosocyanin